MSTFSRFLGLSSAILLVAVSASEASCWAVISWRGPSLVSSFPVAGLQQAQMVNYTLELRTDNMTYFVHDTVIFQGHLEPGSAAKILLTITLTDGSQMTRQLTSNGTGDFDFELYLASAGPYSAFAQLVEPSINMSVTSNVVRLLVSYLPVQTTVNQTSQTSTMIPSSTTSSATGTKTVTTGGPPQNLLLPLIALVVVSILAFAVLLRVVKRTGPSVRPPNST